MRLSSYTPNRFASLMSFADAHEAQRNCNRDTLWLLGDVICAHNLEGVVGVSLLHKHFGLLEQEQLVRRYHDREGRITAEPRSPSYVPCVWAYDIGGEDTLSPVEFADTGVNPESVQDSGTVDQNQKFIDAFGRVVRDRGVENLFGFATLYGIRRINPAPDETLLESSVSDRELKLEVSLLKDVYRVKTAQTLWIFEKKRVESAVACPIWDPQERLMVHCHHCRGHHCPLPSCR